MEATLGHKDALKRAILDTKCHVAYRVDADTLVMEGVVYDEDHFWEKVEEIWNVNEKVSIHEA